MNLVELYKIQKELDDRIHKEHNLEGKNLVTAKILALQVELGELANETRCFKFWSNKASSPKETVLEEYVDCLHFILSIGLDNNFTNIDLGEIDNSKDLVDQFQDIYVRIVTLQYESKIDNYKKLFDNFLLLGKKLGFTKKEIYDSYIQKNKINHQRQDEGY